MRGALHSIVLCVVFLFFQSFVCYVFFVVFFIPIPVEDIGKILQSCTILLIVFCQGASHISSFLLNGLLFRRNFPLSCTLSLICFFFTYKNEKCRRNSTETTANNTCNGFLSVGRRVESFFLFEFTEWGVSFQFGANIYFHHSYSYIFECKGMLRRYSCILGMDESTNSRRTS